MPSFSWNKGPGSGTIVTMYLTITGEVSSVTVTSSDATLHQLVQVQGFQACIPYSQTLQCGPVPLQFLPLTATGFGCPGDSESIVPPAISPSPDDTGLGPNLFCDVLPPGPIDTTPGGGGSVMSPQEKCAAAQKSSALTAARTSYESACGMLRSDQAMVSFYIGAAAAATATLTALVAIAAIPMPIYVSAIIWTLITIVSALAIAFTVLAAQAASRVGSDETILDMAQQAWEAAVAAVKTACCPTADLVCP
jgi:hypothetical protein